MRRIVCVLLCFAMVSANSAFAVAPVPELPEAVKKVVACIGIPEGFVESPEDMRYYEGDDEYILEWKNEDGKRIYMRVFGNGRLSYYSNYEEDVTLVGGRYLPYNEIIDAAESWIKRICPDIYREIRVEGYDERPDRFEIHYQREINGVPVFGDDVQIVVNRYTGGIIHAGFSWTYYDEIVPTENLFSFSRAKKRIGEMLGLERCEVQVRYGEKPIVYALRNKGLLFMVDALTGEPFTQERYEAWDNPSFSLKNIEGEKENPAKPYISCEKATEIFVNLHSPGLCYIKKEEKVNGQKKIALTPVYTLLESSFYETYINASDGMPVDYTYLKPRFRDAEVYVHYPNLIKGMHSFLIKRDFQKGSEELLESVRKRHYDSICNPMNFIFY